MPDTQYSGSIFGTFSGCFKDLGINIKPYAQRVAAGSGWKTPKFDSSLVTPTGIENSAVSISIASLLRIAWGIIGDAVSDVPLFKGEETKGAFSAISAPSSWIASVHLDEDVLQYRVGHEKLEIIGRKKQRYYGKHACQPTKRNSLYIFFACQKSCKQSDCPTQDAEYRYQYRNI